MLLTHCSFYFTHKNRKVISDLLASSACACTSCNVSDSARSYVEGASLWDSCGHLIVGRRLQVLRIVDTTSRHHVQELVAPANHAQR